MLSEAQRPVRGSFNGRKPRPGPLTWPPTGRIRARGRRGEGAKAGGGQRRKRAFGGLTKVVCRRFLLARLRCWETAPAAH